MNKVKVKVLEGGTKPYKKYYSDAGFDLTARTKEQEVDHCGVLCTKYNLGVAFDIPEGYVGLLVPRSSVVDTDMRVSNSVGVIDSQYRGEVSITFDSVTSFTYDIGDRVCQILFVPVCLEMEEVDELNETLRGKGGFGSTGK